MTDAIKQTLGEFELLDSGKKERNPNQLSQLIPALFTRTQGKI